MRVAEFFAGIGLVRMALEQHGFEVVWANDIDPKKLELYQTNFDADHFHLEDIRRVHGSELPDVDLATASFPCTDLSLAGNRRGLQGAQSGMFWEFARILHEMGEKRPRAIMIENVPSFATSHKGQDLYVALHQLNQLGYWCDLMVIDARHFVPQSRPRLFIVGAREHVAVKSDWGPSALRPPWIKQFVNRHPDLELQAMPLTLPSGNAGTLRDIVERLQADDQRWWNSTRVERFSAELSPVQFNRLRRMCLSPIPSWATAYRRTRNGKPAWEIRSDSISGCLRAVRGGSSRQALVEACRGDFRVRWMTPREYARLQGAGEFNLKDIRESQALFGFGDAVCVPVVAWLASNYILPLLSGQSAKLAVIRQEALAFV